MEFDVLSLASSVVLGLSLLSNSISLGSINWATTSSYRVYLNIGLWKSCAGSAGTVEVCASDISSRVDWMKAVAAMMVIAMFACVCAVAASVLFLILKRQKKNLLVISGCAAVAAAVCSLIGVALWGIKIRTDEDYGSLALGWSFGLGVANCVLALIGGIVSFLAALKTEPPHQLLIRN